MSSTIVKVVGSDELVVVIVPGRLCWLQLLEATLTQVCSRVLY
jgi:hypothetical protein